MQIDYIKIPISKEIDEEGGAYIRLVNLLTVALGDSIKEAVKGGYVIGDPVLVTKQFQGLLKSMVDGIERDGMARQIGEYITLYPKFTGPVDLEKGYDPKVNQIKLGVRILGSEYEIDTKNLTFRDVTPGKLTFSVDEASSGKATKMVDIMKEIKITGRDFPNKEDIRIRVEVPELGLSTFVDPDKFTGSVTVLTIAAGALNKALGSKAINGKKATFTVLAGFNNAGCTSTVSDYPHEPKIVKVMGETSGKEDVLDTFYDKAIIEVEGVDLATAKVNLKLFSENGNQLAETDFDGQYVQHEILSPNKIAVKSLANPTREPESVWVMKNKSVFVNVVPEDGTALTHKIVIENE